ARFLGLYSPFGRGRVVDINECHLVSPWFTQVLNQVRQWWGQRDLRAFRPHTGEGELRTLTIREGKRTGDRLVVLTVNGDVAIEGLPLESLVVRRQYSEKGVPTRFVEEVVT